MRKALLMILTLVTLQVVAQDTLQTEQPEKKMSWLRRTIRGFSYIDERYVEPQHYNWSVMLQATHTYDYYRLSTSGSDGQSVWLSPEPNFKVGPYFGWRWIFAGYTFDLKHADVSMKDLKQEIDLSIYSAQIGADIYYRRTGVDYKIRKLNLGKNVDTRKMDGVPFDGISVGITGVNLYYIFNHQRFSYPAAFAQSTIQKISCGSWMVGVTYTQNTIEFDHEKLQSEIDERMGSQAVKLDSGLMFNSVKYYNSSASVGYAYNWVFAKNCLFCSSLSLALAYKRSRGETDENSSKYHFDFNNLNIDGIGRFGLVYNNMRWYAGASVIVRAYNYRKSRFAANNIFGSLNMYIGYNFGARSRYKKKKG
ncbi:MAG: DUF4421 domain-containing protein [Prevotella sp.]|jgi:hypothetical protein|nr:DUF4421 domain-containing protein [Prevotella sp.]MBR1880943.1 DUF4421 domain-containing protein [Prevotella sp.]